LAVFWWWSFMVKLLAWCCQEGLVSVRINSPFSTSWQRGKSHETSLRASVRVISVTTPTAGDRRSHPTSVSTTRTERRRFWPTPAIRQVGHAILMVTTSSPLVFRIRHIWCVPPAKLARNLHVHYGENTKTVSPVAGVGRSVGREIGHPMRSRSSISSTDPSLCLFLCKASFRCENILDFATVVFSFGCGKYCLIIE